MLREFVKKYLDYQTNDIFRDKWVSSRLKELPQGARILDAGAGEQRYKRYCKHLNYTSQDFCQYDGSGDGQALQTGEWDTSKIDIISDISHIPVENESFDAVLCTEVLEHLPYPILAISEFERILKKGGVLLITAPFASLTHFAPFFYNSGFSKYWYEFHMKEKFNIELMEPNGNYFDYMAQEIARINAMQKMGYTTKKIGYFHKVNLFLIYKLLKQMSKNNINSEKLLTVGYHIKAVKK